MIDEEKEILVLGHNNGELEAINLNSMEIIDCKTFEDKEKKKLSIDSLNMIGTFIIAAFSNGVMSIVGKI